MDTRFSFLILLASSVFADRGPCDPLVPEYCSLPMPNSFYTVKDSSTPTGRRVQFSSASLPTDDIGRSVLPNEWNAFDGFSPFPSIITYFPDIDDSTLPPHWDIKKSLTHQSPTILFNLQTSNVVAHFAELDVSFKSDNRKALMIWPSARLNDSTHYLIAIRNLRHSNGTLVSPSFAFRVLRDSIPSNDPDIEFRRADYEMYFSNLASSGVAKRNELQLMWDFQTASQECITKRLLYMRDDSFLRVGPSGPSYTLSQTIDNYTTNIQRYIMGLMNVPLYLNTPLPGSHLVIDERGLPIYQMDAAVTFTVLIPRSVANGSISSAAVHMVQFGHGLFSSQDEVETEYLQEQANRYGYILMSCDLWGMATLDLPSIVVMISVNISNFRIIPDRLSQGIINELLLMRLMKRALYKDPMITFNGKVAINPNNAHYYGVSLGGVLGEVYMSVTTDVVRGVLGVPGGPFGLLLPRSKDFQQFEEIMRLLYSDPVDFMIMLSLMNMLWSRCGPGGYMSNIDVISLPDTPKHQVIYQYGLGDAQVNILGLYSVARSNAAKMFASNVREKFNLGGSKVVTEELYGFQFVTDSAVVIDQSVAVGYDCHAPPEPAGNTPPNATTDTHELPRRAKTAQKQMYLFFDTGEIHNTCGGPCNDC